MWLIFFGGGGCVEVDYTQTMTRREFQELPQDRVTKDINKC